MSRILCVDDEPHLRKTLGANLRARGYEVDLAASGERALELVQEQKPDAVILDLGLPGMSGLQVIRSLRQWTNIPIIVLSARDSEFDKVGALDAGADDYVSKPFGMSELLARLRASLRRSTDDDPSPMVTTDDFIIDLARHEIRNQNGIVRLTPTEWHLVEVLVRNSGKLITSKALLQTIWGPQYGHETNYLRVHMAHIRRKLEPNPGRPQYFHTEPGLGYRYSPPDIHVP